MKEHFGLEWEFDEYQDQNIMIKKIKNDMGKYQTNLVTSRGFPEFDDKKI